MRSLSKRYWLGGASLVAAALLPVTVRRDGLAWESVQVAGYLSAIGCLFLAGASLRPRDARPPKLLTLAQHKWMAWLSVAVLCMHIAGAVLIDRHTIDYLKPSMPAYQLAGLLATLALVILSTTALDRIRPTLWQNPSLFRAVHVVLSALIVVLIFVHVTATDRYTAGPRRWLWIALTLLVLLLPLQRLPQSTPSSRWRLPFRHYGKRISLAFVLAALACLGLAAQTRERRARLTLEPVVPRAHPLRIEFPHERHGAVNCITCHHNFVDQTGVDSCIPCHRSKRPDILLGAQARFHLFCMDCHREGELSARSEKHGPVSQCRGCHRPLVHEQAIALPR